MKHLQKWGLPLLTGVVVLAAVLLPRQISALRDRQTLDAVHTEPMAQEDLTPQEAALPEKLGLLGRAIRYPGLDVYSAPAPGGGGRGDLVPSGSGVSGCRGAAGGVGRPAGDV